ncbi:MAG TPA: hypothetical protein VK973_02015 [Arenicellales bacterium]|nr:hypothetical protein [Arenicellales bacterium]
MTLTPGGLRPTRLCLCGSEPTQHPTMLTLLFQAPGSRVPSLEPSIYEENFMHQIIYIIGAIVIVLVVLRVLGLW